MVTFILNNTLITTDRPSGSTLLDFIRYDAGLTGTKIGCREGDCGACTVLLGSAEDKKVRYRSIVSCLTPLENVGGKHIVTIEGINTFNLSPIQQAFVDNAASQCGFCTPGFIMSLTGEALSGRQTTEESVIGSMSGNICRCTGYKSIERAAAEIVSLLKEKDTTEPVLWLVNRKYLPDYFLTIPDRLAGLKDEPEENSDIQAVAGGTDLMVQKGEELSEKNLYSFGSKKELKGISSEGGRLIIGAATTLEEIKESEIISNCLPDLKQYLKYIASGQIRNMATVAGNIINASPIGDFTIMLLALRADLVIEGSEKQRILPLSELYAGYKKLNLQKGESVVSIVTDRIPMKFSFEKVSKRTYLDIASVNSAICINTEGDIISDCTLSAGGVAPVPLLLKKTGEYLKGRTVNPETIRTACELLQSEAEPISDVRGSISYKRLLLRQLFIAHILKLFPGTIKLKDVI